MGTMNGSVGFDLSMYLTDHTEAEREAWDKARLVDERNIQVDGDLPDGYVLKEPITAHLAAWADGTHSLFGRFGLGGTSAHGLDGAVAFCKRFLVYRLRRLEMHVHSDHWVRSKEKPEGWCIACSEQDYLQSIIARKNESNP